MNEAEFDQLVEIISDAGAREVSDEKLRELIAWFTRRYPTPFDRLAYVRKKMMARAASRSPLRRPPSRS